MVERVKLPWKASDGETFATKAEAEQHEGQVELLNFIFDALRAGPLAGEENRDLAGTCAEQVRDAIKLESAAFIALLRKAGVPVVTRAKVKAKKAVKVAAE